MEHRLIAQEIVKVSVEKDLLTVRSILREYCKKMLFSDYKTMKLLTATSEITQNMIHYAAGGLVRIKQIDTPTMQGIQVECIDRGKGIINLELAMQNGYSTRKSLGLGLPGAKKLVDNFSILSSSEEGTKVIMSIWHR